MRIQKGLVQSVASFERALIALQERLRRVTRALEGIGVEYAIVCGCASAAWVCGVDESAERLCPEVEILIERGDIEKVRRALDEAGFFRRQTPDKELFLDGPGAPERTAIRIQIAGEKLKDDHPEPLPCLDGVITSGRGFKTLPLDALARMFLARHRTVDRMLLRDLIDVGLVGRQHCAELPPILAERLAWILDHPED